jgi:hypothetical protein
MRDPERLLDANSDEFERSLLRSAGRDEGSRQAFERMQAAIGVGGAGAALSLSAGAKAASPALGAGKGTTAGTSLLVAKWLGIGAVSGALVTGGVTLSRPSPEPPVPVSVSASADGAKSVRTAKHGEAPAPAVPQPSLPVPNAQDPPGTPASPDTNNEDPANGSPRVATTAVRDGLTARSSAPDVPVNAANAGATNAVTMPEPPERRLADEVALIDGARSALARRDATAALTVIARHDREFAAGPLALEADVLRVRALLLAGDRASAERVGHVVMARHPGPYANRVADLLTGRQNP